MGDESNSALCRLTGAFAPTQEEESQDGNDETKA